MLATCGTSRRYHPRMIVYCCADLIFATKVRSTADSLGIVTRPVRDAPMLQKRLDRVDDGKPNEAVTALLIDLDTGDAGLALIEQAKRHDATLPVIAFGAHVAVEILEAARQRGADEVMPRGSFTRNLPQLLESLASRKAG
jgi:CheY-like chemotaxis protein